MSAAKKNPGGDCVFCAIARGALPAAMVLGEADDDGTGAAADAGVLAFLDRTPLFQGHVLVIPRAHVETLADLPREAIDPLFFAVQRVARAVEIAMGAKGTFVAANNRVSQSVPHLHVHVVPRAPKDGLKGFFWPRTSYPSDEAMNAVAARIKGALD